MDTFGITPPHSDVAESAGRRLSSWTAEYLNDRSSNTNLFHTFDRLSRAPDWLARHRDWVEANAWGFGDRALHHMWHLLIEHIATTNGGSARCLEVGVFKGQVISLWALIAAQHHFDLSVTALSPFAGSAGPVVRNRLASKLMRMLSRSYRTDALAGNIYAKGDYLQDCRRIYQEFGLDFDRVEVLRGFSTDPKLLASLERRTFDLIYIDGDHSEAGAMRDVENFSSKVAAGGFLVMDDASLSLEMDLPYRGRTGPSKAADTLSSRGFANVLNVGHNRVFQKV